MEKPIDPSSDDWAAWAELEQAKQERDQARQAMDQLEAALREAKGHG